MSARELIYSESILRTVADLLCSELAGGSLAVSRVQRLVSDRAVFVRGKCSHTEQVSTMLCNERIEDGVYSTTHADDVLPDCFRELRSSLNLQEHRFRFTFKGMALPATQSVIFEDIPTGVDQFDDEFRQFTREHPGARIARSLDVDQRVVVNSSGGVAIQSVPFMLINFNFGYQPFTMSRNLNVAVNSNEEIAGMTELVKYMPDPTLDRRVQLAGSFSEAFHELVRLSPVHCATVEEAGLPARLLNDVVMLNGVPAHEIFGHHFEEPVHMLGGGDTAAFRQGQQLSNAGIVLKDNARQQVAGYRLAGFAHFDAYGRERRERVHIRDGAVKEFLGGEYADRQKIRQYLGGGECALPGNSSQYIDGQFPQVRMSCTVLDGPAAKMDWHSKIVIVPHAGHTRPDDKTYAVISSECYVLGSDGVPRRIGPLRVTGGIHQALESLVLLDRSVLTSGMCGKPEPIYFPQSRGEASVPVSQFARAQLWQGQQVYPIPLSPDHIAVLKQG